MEAYGNKITILTNKNPTKFIIYMAKSPSGKRYVGLTSQKLKTRIHNHNGDANRGIKRPLYFAIRKYGIQSINWYILDYADTYEELKELEVYWIEKHNTTLEYNISTGGEGQFGIVKSREERNELSIRRGGRKFFVYDSTGKYIGKFTSTNVCSEEIGIKGRSIRTRLKEGQSSPYMGFIFSYRFLSDGKKALREDKRATQYIVYDFYKRSYNTFSSILSIEKEYHISKKILNEILDNGETYKNILLFSINNKTIKRTIADKKNTTSIIRVYDIRTWESVGRMPNMKECSNIFNCDNSDLTVYLKRQGYFQSKGFFYIYEDNMLRFKSIKEKIIQKNNEKVFAVFNRDNLFVGEWSSMRQCMRELELPNSQNIGACLNEKNIQKTYKGYSFKWVNR